MSDSPGLSVKYIALRKCGGTKAEEGINCFIQQAGSRERTPIYFVPRSEPQPFSFVFLRAARKNHGPRKTH